MNKTTRLLILVQLAVFLLLSVDFGRAQEQVQTFNVPLNPTMLSEVGLNTSASSFNYVNVVDGSIATNGWHTDNAVAGANVSVALSKPEAVVQARLYVSGLNLAAQYRVQYSDNARYWTNASGIFAPVNSGWNTRRWSNVGEHLYWRLRLENTPGPGPWINELELYCESADIPLRTSMLSAVGFPAFSPEAALDEDINTNAWHTDHTDSAELIIDLGQTQQVESVRIYAETVPPQSGITYNISLSHDRYSWNSPGTIYLNAAGWNAWNIPRSQMFFLFRRYMKLTARSIGVPLSPWINELQLLTRTGSYIEVPLSPGMVTSAPGVKIVDLGRPRAIVQVGMSGACYSFDVARYPCPMYGADYSDDAVTWRGAGTMEYQACLLCNANYYEGAWASVGAHQFWRIYRVPTSGGAESTMNDLRLFAVRNLRLEPLTAAMITQSGLSSFDADAIVGAETSTCGWYSWASMCDWSTDTAAPGAWLQVDLGTAKPIVHANLFAATSRSRASYAIEYSDDSATWATAATGIIPAVQGRNGIDWPACGSHRYWRLLLENSPSAGPWFSQLELLSDSSDETPPAVVQETIDASMLTQSGLTAFDAVGTVDSSTYSQGWQTDASVAGAWMQVDLGQPRPVVLMKIWAAAGDSFSGTFAQYLGGVATCAVQYSDDGASWATAASEFSTRNQGWNYKGWSNYGAHRYWRLLLENTPGPGSWMTELQLFSEQP